MKALMQLYYTLSILVTVSITSKVNKSRISVVGNMGRHKRQILSSTRCPTPWTPFSGHCYRVSTTTVSWTTAVQECQRFNAYLVEVDSEEENAFVIWLLSRSSGTVVTSTTSHRCYDEPFSEHTWIGLNDRKEEGRFVWAHSETTPSFQKWGGPNPDDWYGLEDCVEIVYKTWNDNNCDCYKPYVCEMEIRQTTTTSTTAATTDTTEATKATTAATTEETAATTEETAATTPETFEISWTTLTVGFAAIGFVAVVVAGVVACAVRRRRRRNMKESNSEVVCANSKESDQNNYSLLAFGDHPDTESCHYTAYCPTVQDVLYDDGRIYENLNDRP